MVHIERYIRIFLHVPPKQATKLSAHRFKPMVDCSMTYLPIVYSRLLGHELVDTRAALGRPSDLINVQSKGDSRTYIAKHEAVQTNKFCELSVAFVYLSCSAPQTSRDGHRREHAVIIKEQTFECFLNEHQINIGERLCDCLRVWSVNIDQTLLI